MQFEKWKGGISWGASRPLFTRSGGAAICMGAFVSWVPRPSRGMKITPHTATTARPMHRQTVASPRAAGRPPLAAPRNRRSLRRLLWAPAPGGERGLFPVEVGGGSFDRSGGRSTPTLRRAQAATCLGRLAGVALVWRPPGLVKSSAGRGLIIVLFRPIASAGADRRDARAHTLSD